MAVSDLNNELSKGTKLSNDVHDAVYDRIVKLLHDNSSEVQGIAIKFFPVFIQQTSPAIAERAISMLADSMLEDGKKASSTSDDMGVRSMKDISALLLKTTFPVLPASSEVTSTVITTLVPKLLIGLRDECPLQAEINCLEVLNDLLPKFQATLEPQHNDIATVVLEKLESQMQTVRKKASVCVATLATTVSPSLFHWVVDQLISAAEKPGNNDEVTRVRLQVLSAVSRTAAHRFKPDTVSRAMGLILQKVGSIRNQDEELEILEAAVQILDAWALKIPKELKKYIREIIELLSLCMRYDPNYAEEDVDLFADASEAMEGVENSDSYGADPDNDDDDFDYESDDDDVSWRARRAAVRCARSIIGAGIMELGDMYRNLGLVLMQRLAEREENVRCEVFAAVAEALERVNECVRNREEGDMDIDSGSAAEENRQADAVLEDIRSKCSKLAEIVQKELTSKSAKTSIVALKLLQELVDLAPDLMYPRVSKMTTELTKVLGDPNVQVKSSSLSLISHVKLHSPAVLSLHPLVMKATNDKFYKIVAKALQLNASIAKSLKEADNSEVRAATPQIILNMHDAARKRVDAADQDSEVKDAALDCLGACVAYHADILGSAAVDTAGVICDRLKNEVNRLSAVRALQKIAHSASLGVLEPHITTVESSLCAFLSKANYDLRRWSLMALVDLVPGMPPASDRELIQQLRTMIAEQDLRLSALAISVLISLLRSRQPSIVPVLKDIAWEPLLSLTMSPLLQGQVLQELQTLLDVLAKVNESPLRCTDMLDDVIRRAVIYASENKRSPADSTAKCVAVLIKASPQENEGAIKVKLAEDVASEVAARKLFALTCITELGRTSTLPRDSFTEELREAVLEILLNSTNEEERSSAAVALGAVSSGDSEGAVQYFIDLVRRRPDKRYLLLMSLKETIAFTDKAIVARFSSNLLPLLLEEEEKVVQAASEDASTREVSISTEAGQESVRTATAECLGLLVRADPENIFPVLEEIYLDESRLYSLRASAVMSIRFAIGRESRRLDQVLKSRLGEFQRLFPSPTDVHADQVPLIRGALLSLDAIARHRVSLLQEASELLLSKIFALMKPNKKLVRIINLGPFKCEEDDGLEIRKAAFTLIGTLLSKSPRVLDMGALGDVIASGLKDLSEIRALAQFSLIDVVRSPQALGILGKLDDIVAALTDILKERPKENAVRQEVEKYEDSIRGALRAVVALEKVPEIANDHNFSNMMSNVVHTPELEARYEAAAAEAIVTRRWMYDDVDDLTA